MNRLEVTFSVNGREFTLPVQPQWTLLDVLREELGLTGTKRGCEIGECGACTVVMNGAAVNACLVPAPQIQGTEIITVEGLAAPDGTLHPLQQAFLEHGAVQCGFCTPGLLMSAKALLDADPHPSEARIREAIGGNLCRCTGYVQIVEAIQSICKERMRP